MAVFCFEPVAMVGFICIKEICNLKVTRKGDEGYIHKKKKEEKNVYIRRNG